MAAIRKTFAPNYNPSPKPPPKRRFRPANDPWKKPYRPGPKPTSPFGKPPAFPKPVPPWRPVGPPAKFPWFKLGSRFLPYFGYLIYIHELGQPAQWANPSDGMPKGYDCKYSCNPIGYGPPNGIAASASSPGCSFIMAGGSCFVGIGSPSVPPNSVYFEVCNFSEYGWPFPPGTMLKAQYDIYNYPAPPVPMPGPDFVPVPTPAVYMPPVSPQYPEWLDPNAIPIGVPTPFPAIPPFPMPEVPIWNKPAGDPSPMPDPDFYPWIAPPHPRYDPLPEPAWRPSPRPRTRPRQRPRPRPRPGRNPDNRPSPEIPIIPNPPITRPNPGVTPVWETPIVPNPSPTPEPVPQPQPALHAQRPPRKNERERKKRHPWAGAVWSAASGVTETGDFIKAAYDALPPSVRRYRDKKGKWRDKDITPQDRLKRLWNNWDKIDMNDFVENVAMNHLQDKAIGALSGAALKSWLKAQTKYGYNRPVSLETGPVL